MFIIKLKMVWSVFISTFLEVSKWIYNAIYNSGQEESREILLAQSKRLDALEQRELQLEKREFELEQHQKETELKYESSDKTENV